MQDPLVAACGIWLPEQASNLGHQHWERGVLVTGPPGKSLFFESLSSGFVYLFRFHISVRLYDLPLSV